MPVRIANTQLVYVPVPKIACTSIKFAILDQCSPDTAEILRASDLPGKGVHGIFPSVAMRPKFAMMAMSPLTKWFCVVRDPLRRFVSGYRNRILHHRDLEALDRSVFEHAGLSPNPDPDEFAMNLGRYAEISGSTKHHFGPLCMFLGHRPRMFHRIFCISEIDEIANYMAAYGGPAEIPHEQTGGPKMSVKDLSPNSIAHLQAYYSNDYRVWGPYIKESDGTETR